MKRMGSLVTLVVLVLALFPGIARAGVPDADDTDGPFDLRQVDVRPKGQDRLMLTVRFWPGFTSSALRYGSTLDPDRRVYAVIQGAPDGDFTNGAYQHDGYFFRRAGAIWFRNGEFASSPCCWTSKVTRVDPTTLRVRFIPWWVRLDEADNDIPLRVRVATTWCADGSCVRDHSRWAYS